MIIDFLKAIDTEKTDPQTVEVLKSMGSVVEGALNDFLKDVISKKDLESKLDEALKSIDTKTELNTVQEQMNGIKESIIKMKGAMEKNEQGEMVIKSIDRQIEEQLKDFIKTNEKGYKTVDLRGACKSSAGFKKTLNLVLDTKAVSTITSGSIATGVYGNVIDQTISVEPRANTIIRQVSNVASISGRSVTYAEFQPGEGDAKWVEEGALKPNMDGTLTEVTINAGKVALTAKLTEETLTDLPQLVAEIRAEIINRIALAEEKGILSGTGTSGEIKGIKGDVPGFSLTTLSVANPNTYDAIVAAYTQIISTSNMAYRPNLVLMNPLDYAQMQLTKDVNGQYLRPFRSGDELIQGLRVETSTAVTQGDLWIGDFNYLNIRDVWELQITFGWENDDFTKNLVTMIGEKRLLVYIKSQYKTAFVFDKIATIIEAITKA